MGEHLADPRITMVLKTLDAYRGRDVQAMQKSMAPDVVLEALGDNPLAGTYEGIGGVLAFISKSMSTFIPGTVAVDGVEVVGDEVHVVVRAEMALVDGTCVSAKVLQRYRFGPDGRVCWIANEAAENGAEFDRILTEKARLT